MTLATLLVTATKLAGALFSVTVAANAFSFSRYKRKNLSPFKSPIDESADVLAEFIVNPTSEGEKGFFFGLATAPAHVEDRLNDAWLQFAEQNPCDQPESQKGTQPADAVMASAAGDGGAQLARMPDKEANKSMKRKKQLRIAMEAKIRGFEKYEEIEEPNSGEECHHTVASWHNVPHPEERLRFWSDPDTELKLAKDTGIQVFRMGIDWTRVMPEEPINGPSAAVNFAALERYKWIINRVHSYGMKVMLTLFHHSLPPWAAEYGGWKLEKTVEYFMEFTRVVVDCVSDLVDYWVTFNEPHVFCMLTYCAGAWPGGNPDMLEAATSALPTGVFNQAMHLMAIAHSKAYDYIHEKSAISSAIVGVAHHVSFMRPYGLFDIAAVSVANSLTLFPFMDSISDKLDYIGINYYGQEVVSGAGLKLVDTDIGVPILGYLFWTISDNWEWADGYGPKFGLVAVDRLNNLARIPRPSYHLFKKVITRIDRARAWNELQTAAKEGKTRPFYRAVNKHGLMYAGGLDKPILRPYVIRDWRFGHYEMEGLQDPLSRFSRYLLRPFFLRKKINPNTDSEDLVLEPLMSSV
ncbi:UNVERIFIED_CONTAM: Beta-glucosidase-like SFR2, chloroplastic [Sesamum latifolium]|uniref:Beta-glucosidase-like SFR2, chloroplastic n=1 Tax=Sesamum latifolium TaxID=2727402 RepID=A0AAW2XWL5_9LAMI